MLETRRCPSARAGALIVGCVGYRGNVDWWALWRLLSRAKDMEHGRAIVVE